MTISEDPEAGQAARFDDVSFHIRNHDAYLTIPTKPEDVESKLKCCTPKLTPPEWAGPEMKVLIKYSWPMVIVCLMQYASTLISVIFCGRLGTSVLAGTSLAISMINISVLSVSMGLSAACDTLFSQSYGSTNKSLLGVYLQRSLMILLLSSIPAVAILLNAENIFLAIGENPAVSRVAGEYLLLYVPGAIAMFLYQVLLRYVMSQDRVLPLIVVATLSDVVDVVAHYYLINEVNLGHNGSAIALSLTHVCLFLFTTIYILASRLYKETWAGWSREAFYEWGNFMKLALPGLFMISTDYLVFEVGIILAALLGDVYVSALSILFQIIATGYQIYIALGVSVCMRVGQRLGGGDGVAARQSSIIGLLAVTPPVLLVILLFALIPEELIMIFTNEPEVIALAASILPICPAIYQIFNGINVISSGILRGSGRQTIGMLAVMVPYLTVGIPIAIPCMMLTDMALTGFFMGLTTGMFMQFLISAFYVYRTKWDVELEKAAKNTKTMECAKASEKTGLLAGSSTDDSEYGTVEIDHMKLSNESGCCLVLKRLLAAFVVLLVLAAGLLLRFYLTRTGPFPDDCLDLGLCNSTTVFPTNVMKERLFGIFR